jgi:carboxypeptidase C (cathepsin A)
VRAKIINHQTVPLAFLAFFVACPTLAQDNNRPAFIPVVLTDEPTSVTHHAGIFDGRHVDYAAVAGNTIIHDRAGKATASMFSVAYLADNTPPSVRRPVTFLLNGGPSSASFWIQMGALGPKIVELHGPDSADTGSPAHRIIDNPDALLDATDLVFIDPVGTSYSHALGTSKDGDFFKTSSDAASIADFIVEWLTKNKRWESPRFVGGESYGSIRTALILAHDPWMSFNGTILISQGLDWGTVMMPRGYDLGYEHFLASYAATASYYHLVPQFASVEKCVEQAKAFAYSDYASALAKGATVGAIERDEIANRLGQLTGIPASTWTANDLRIPPDQFRRTILAAKGLRVGRFDSRYSTRTEPVFDSDEKLDPSLSAAAVPYLEAMRAYLVEDLKVDRPSPYLPLAPGEWTYDLDNDAFLNPAPHIGDAMRSNAAMKLFVASGYYDFSSPVASASYNIGHAGIPMDRVTMRYYETGHMMYVNPEGRRALLHDIRSFILTSSN